MGIVNKRRIISLVAIAWTAAALQACTVYTHQVTEPAEVPPGAYDPSDPNLNPSYGANPYGPPGGAYPQPLSPGYYSQRPDYDPALDRNGHIIGYCFRPNVPVTVETKRKEAGPFTLSYPKTMCRHPNGKLTPPQHIRPQTPPYR